MQKYGTIYILKNKINNKCYVGQTIQKINRRIRSHFNVKIKSYISHATLKYGKDNFEIFIFKEIPINLLDYFEIELIKRLNTFAPYGYNIELGGYTHKIVSKETKIKISKNHANMQGKNNPMYGQIHTIEVRKIISKIHKNKIISESIKQKMSKNNYKSKKVICINNQKIFNSIREAGEYYQVDHMCIINSCKNRLKSGGKDFQGNKLHWMYYRDYLKLICGEYTIKRIYNGY
jgi:group I intron endonuclease